MADAPVSAQIAVVNKVVLPLLHKLGINVTVTIRKQGMRLDLKFVEPAVSPDGVRTAPDADASLLAMREKIAEYRRDHPDLANAK